MIDVIPVTYNPYDKKYISQSQLQQLFIHMKCLTRYCKGTAKPVMTRGTSTIISSYCH